MKSYILNNAKEIALSVCLLATGSAFFSCEGDLEPVNFDNLNPTTFFQTEEDATAILASAYNLVDQGWMETPLDGFGISEITGGLLHVKWGDAVWPPLLGFTWSALTESATAKAYNRFVPGVTFATNVIEDLKIIPLENEALKSQMIAEVRAIRAFMVLTLLDLYGPVPIVTDPTITTDINTDFDPERWTEEATVQFIETELLAAEPALPVKHSLGNWGRLSRAAAMMMRLKLYMHQKDWTKANEVSSQIMASGEYGLVPDFEMIFSVDNEGNEEVIWSKSAEPGCCHGMTWTTRTLPGDFRTEGMTASQLTSWNGIRVPWEIYDTFESGDERQDRLIKDYLVDDANGNPVMVDGRATDRLPTGAISLKYGIDPNIIGAWTGNDWIIYRYADVLLARAEALNEESALNGEAIDLANQVRNRAGLPNVSAADFPGGQSEFRDFILDERIKELYSEGWVRQDLIRHDKFIERAQTRILNNAPSAAPHHRLFPIPQSAIDANPKITQNPGY